MRGADKAIELTESGLLPDALVRHGIRRLLKQRLAVIHADDCEMAAAATAGFIELMDESPIAAVPERANEQHYEVPAAFFREILGASGKYSCCYWGDSSRTLDEAETEALRITCERAGIAGGQRVLDLGCGWGSLSLYIAGLWPTAQVTAVSNSRSQHDYIVTEARRRGLNNVKVVVADMNDFQASGRYDRIVSVEMFEHMRNYRALFGRVSHWLSADGLFFMHIFCHRSTPYAFVDRGPNDWMSRHFFSGGIMPSADLPLYFQDRLAIRRAWRWNGRHYAQTSNAWLQRMDERRASILPILRATYGDAEAQLWWARWRIFFMACAELFDYANGEEWFVGHYLFAPRAQPGER